MELAPTPSQTIGPFFHLCLTTDAALGIAAGADVKGERIRLACRVFDADGAPVDDAMIEIWQADAAGTYATGLFGRLCTNDAGVCVFETVKPGSVDRVQAPHMSVLLFARGLLKQLTTRIYFAGEAANQNDPILTLVPEDRRGTLLAHPSELGVWNFDIRLGGDTETVFFDV